MSSRLLVLGGGRMGTALIGGLVKSGWADACDCAVFEPRPEGRQLLEHRFPGLQVSAELHPAEAVVLAMKPTDVEAACRSLEINGYDRVLSIVAGATLANLESWLWSDAPVIRAMPNLPSLVGAAATAIAGGSSAQEDDLEWAESVLSSIGVVVRLPENLLDAVTGLSGSGPAYVFLVTEALVEAGIAAGLDPEVARLLTVQTVLGAARLLDETGESAASLRESVTSPGGTTAEGLRVLESRSLRGAFVEAVAAATNRSRELAQGN